MHATRDLIYVCFLALSACAGQPDMTLQKEIVGTWSGIETRPGVVVSGIDTYQADGKFTVVANIRKDGAVPFEVQTSGEWRVEKGWLITEITKTDNSALAPIGDKSSDKVIRVTSESLELETSHGLRLLRERKRND